MLLFFSHGHLRDLSGGNGPPLLIGAVVLLAVSLLQWRGLGRDLRSDMGGVVNLAEAILRREGAAPVPPRVADSADALALLSHMLDIAPDPAGMHLVCPLKPACPMDDRTIATRAREAGLGLRALSAYFETADAPQGLVMGYAGFDADTLQNAAETLRRILTK